MVVPGLSVALVRCAPTFGIRLFGDEAVRLKAAKKAQPQRSSAP